MTTKAESKAGARTQHTPGPWSTEWRDESVGYHINGPEKDGGWKEIIAQTVSGNAIANARLIAAAPELLEASRAALEYLDGSTGSPVSDRLRAAIAKAEGKA